MPFITAFDSKAQLSTFREIKESFLCERPQTGDFPTRSVAINSLDRIIYNNYPPIHPGNREYMKSMIEKAFLEIRNEEVTEGASVWLIYNHGFVVKTPTVCLGFDLFDYYGFDEFINLADMLDMYFISHEHVDHYSKDLITEMIKRGKPVVGEKNFKKFVLNTPIDPGDTLMVSDVHIVAHYGEHSVPVRQYEVTSPEGIRILHTGDNSSISTLPAPDSINILLINCWIEGWGGRINPYSLARAITRVKPDVTLPGHFMELRHFTGSSPPIHWDDGAWTDVYKVPGEYHVLTWGERYHFDKHSNDTINPNSLENVDYQLTEDSIHISWDNPKIAIDGDSAAFYRIILDDSVEYFLTGRQYSMPWDSIGNHPVKIFAYDACGNQGTGLELDVIIPDTNYPPRIIHSDPGINDTVDVFAGVSKVFYIETMDPNNDSLHYVWKINDQLVQEGPVRTYVYHFPDLQPGPLTLTAIVSDSGLSRQIAWQLNHYNEKAIIDNTDTLMFSASDHWRNVRDPSAYGGTFDSLDARSVGDWAQFNYSPAIEGYYDISVHIPTKVNGYSVVEYHIIINGRTVDTVDFIQRYASGTWSKIGNYYLPDNAEVSVKLLIISGPYAGIIAADAVRFEPGDPETGIHQIRDSDSPVLIYPNPFQTAINIESEYPLVSLRIYNSSGIILRQFNNITGCIDQGDLTPGIYFIRIITGQGEIYIYRLVKE